MDRLKLFAKILGLFFLAVAVSGKHLRPNPAMPKLCDKKSAAVRSYLLAYTYSQNDPGRARTHLAESVAIADCPELIKRIRALEERL